ncbi:hypothetical protein GCM10010430_59010 [Kitasatospora cystarginea]|uniref:Uncharacterized protein n=1 Tax=Kitasatospora cystarginea TaxID=58350 RepID=A0ABP5RLE9_9ACTN
MADRGVPQAIDPDDPDRLGPATAASAVFRAVAADQPLPAAATAPPDTGQAAGPPSGPDPPTPTEAGSRLSDGPTGGAVGKGGVAVSTDDTTPFGPPAPAHARNPQIPDSAP